MIEEKFEDIIKEINDAMEEQPECGKTGPCDWVEVRRPPNYAERVSITEEESKDVIEGWFKEVDEIHTYDEVRDFIRRLMTNYNHDYGTIVHAMTAGALVSIKAMDRDEWEGGITGFQASCVMWEFMKRFMHYDGPMRLIQYKNMLYPQYGYHFERTISKSTWRWLQEEAKQHLASGHSMAPEVKAHMKSIVDGVVPFQYRVK